MYKVFDNIVKEKLRVKIYMYYKNLFTKEFTMITKN